MKAYIKGYYKERSIVNKARKMGCIAFRSAGSHSPIDVCIIDEKNRKIFLVQSKGKSFSDKAKEKLYDKYKYLDGVYKVRFNIL